MNIPFFNAQADLLHSIAQLRGGWLDFLFLFLNYFDTQYFLMILIPLVWVGISYRWGLRLAVLLIFNTLVNYHLKHLFDLPRPIVAFPNLAMFPYSTPGFPSGGAQTATLLAGLLIYSWKSPWSWVVGLSYAALISFSRLYLAVHYPMDVLGGISIGIAILFLYIYTIPYIEIFCKKEERSTCVIIAIILAFLYAFLEPSPKGFQLMGALVGFCTGAYASSIFRLYPNRPRSLWTRILSGVLAVLILYGLYFLLPSRTPLLLQSFLLSLWISLPAAPFCTAIIPFSKKNRA